MPESIDILENNLLYENPKLLEVLLIDHTTNKNIFWATDSYIDYGKGYGYNDNITVAAITGKHGNIIMPRALKSRSEQMRRSRQMAEVFTPLWVVKKMNNFIDVEWHTTPHYFDNSQDSWKNYILTTILEITCGEAPFLTSRYDTVSGEPIDINNRVGMLDRKLQVVNSNSTDKEWKHWALLALGSVYGYEWQGDNLLLARESLLATFNEYHEQRFGVKPDKDTMLKAAEIISWNVWQMDGLKGVVPCSCYEQRTTETNLFSANTTTTIPCQGCSQNNILLHNGKRCRLSRWMLSTDNIPNMFECLYIDFINKKYITYHKTKLTMKFDFVIGNPPYQEETNSDSTRMPPVYNYFMDEAYKVSMHSLLITPARFLFNIGFTPKKWNNKMLNDNHFKVLEYYQKSGNVFPNTDIKGGIIISYYNEENKYEPIKVFTTYNSLNKILQKVTIKSNKSLTSLIYPALSYDVSDLMKKDNPALLDRLRTSAFTNLSSIFFEEQPSDKHEYIRLLGLLDGKRVMRYVRKDYILDKSKTLPKWKVFVPESNGSGALGEVLSTPLIGKPLIGKPLIGHTQTFMSIGCFDTEQEAQNLLKYIKSKFARTMLGVLKVTQHNPPKTWKYVPLQDFTSSSDIDWTKSVHEIDLQLYDKYGLTAEERNFIETNVKEMD